MKHPKFVSDGSSWTYSGGHHKEKLDYILMSPKLLGKVQKGGIERRGVWRTEGHFPEMQKETDAASDHAALWADLDI